MTAFDKAWGVVKSDRENSCSKCGNFIHFQDEPHWSVGKCRDCISKEEEPIERRTEKKVDALRDALGAARLPGNKMPLKLPNLVNTSVDERQGDWRLSSDDMHNNNPKDDRPDLRQSHYRTDTPETTPCVRCDYEMPEGYLDQGAGWFCSRRCLGMSNEDFIEAYNTGETVWTTVGDN